jgi:hypothetical protein
MVSDVPRTPAEVFRTDAVLIEIETAIPRLSLPGKLTSVNA